MYSQFFGNYLLTKQIVTKEQLLRAMEIQHTKHVKIGTLAIHAGYMDASQVERVVVCQTHENKRFGELAIEYGYLTSEQRDALLEQQTPDYLLIGQALVDEGAISPEKLAACITSYQEEQQISQLDDTAVQQDNLQFLLKNLFLISSSYLPDYMLTYITLLFNNLIRFVGEDFTPLAPTLCTEHITNHCSSQIINGEFSMTSFIDMDETTAIKFASRYAGDTLTEYDEYVKASIEDFLNLHNGLFCVNISNEDSVELMLNPPTNMENTLVSSLSELILFPIMYPFGILNILIKL